MFVDKSWVFFSDYFSKTNYWNCPRIKRFEPVGFVGPYDKVPPEISKAGFIGFPCFLAFLSQLWGETRGHTFWNLKFLENIYWLFLGGNLKVSSLPTPPGMALPCDLQPAWASSVATTLSSQAVHQMEENPKVIKPLSKHQETVAVSSASKGTCCFNNTGECFCEVLLLPRTWLSGPGTGQLILWACLSWNVMAS